MPAAANDSDRTKGSRKGAKTRRNGSKRQKEPRIDTDPTGDNGENRRNRDGTFSSVSSVCSCSQSSSVIRVSSVFNPWLFLQVTNRRGLRETPRERASLRSSASSAVRFDELSACRWDISAVIFLSLIFLSFVFCRFRHQNPFLPPAVRRPRKLSHGSNADETRIKETSVAGANRENGASVETLFSLLAPVSQSSSVIRVSSVFNPWLFLSVFCLLSFWGRLAARMAIVSLTARRGPARRRAEACAAPAPGRRARRRAPRAGSRGAAGPAAGIPAPRETAVCPARDTAPAL